MRILMVGPSNVIAMQRPFGWVVNAGHEVWLLAGKRIRYGVQREYVYIPLLAEWIHRFLVRWVGRPAAAALYMLFGALQLRLTVWRLKPDLVHAHHLKLDAGLCALAGVKPLVVSTWGGLRPDEQAPARLDNRWRIIRRVLRKADAFIVETPILERRVRDLAGHPVRTAVIPLGADPDRFRPYGAEEVKRLREEWGIPEQAVVLLSPRGCDPAYGQHHILEAFALARPRQPRDTVLVFVSLLRGYPSDAAAYQERLRARAAKLGIENFLRWIPECAYERMPAIYAIADVVVSYPSHDTAPSTLVEAVLCGKPIVTSRLPNFAGSLIERFGTLVEPENPAALAEVIVRAMQALSSQTAQREEARAAFAEQYNERQAARRLLGFYEEIGSSSDHLRQTTWTSYAK